MDKYDFWVFLRECKKQGLYEELVKILREENIIQSEERPQGEWIRTGSLGNGNAHYECSKCHYGDEHAESQEVPYCWHCGASMKKGGAEMIEHDSIMENGDEE